MNGSGDRREGPSEITREIQWIPKGASEPRTFLVRVGLPVPDPELGGFICTLRIEGDGWDALVGAAAAAAQRPGIFHDTHAMLALTLALNMVPEVIEYHVKKAGGRVLSPLRFLEEPEDEEPPIDSDRGAAA